MSDVLRRCPPVVAVIVLVLLLAACATAPQSRQLASEPPAGVAPRAELERVPFFPQEDYQCGPAALATILADLGEPVTAESLVGEVYIPARQGSLQAEMRASARTRGYVAYPLRPELAAILAEVDDGRPVLVMQNLGLDWIPTWHYAVVIGYDLEARELVLRSETIRRHVVGFSTFERTWARADYWAQVIVPPDRPPITAEPVTWLEAVFELEQTGHHAAAARGYRATTRQWPHFHPGWMAYGNAAYARGAYARANAAYLEAIAVEPGTWSAWNNLAHGLDASACPLAADAAAHCAIALSPESETARATLDSLASGTSTGDQCPLLPPCPVTAAEQPNP